MAGDWIKMRGNLWDDPRVAALVEATDAGEAAVIGGLYWLWATADQHTEDGCMPGLTLRQIDRKTGVAGLGQALCDIGWLAIQEGGVLLANFTEHNGASAKRRAGDAQRKANGRNVSASDADKERTEPGKNADDLRRSAELEKEKRREELIQGEPPIGGLSASPPDGAPKPAEQGRQSPNTGASLDDPARQQALDGLDPPPPAPAVEPKQKPQVPPCPYDALINLYEQTLPMCPAVRRGLFKDGKRAEAMRARWVWVMTGTQEVGENAGRRMATTTDEGIAWFGKFFAHAAGSDFLTGRSGKWTADLEFLMTASKFASVLEGKYHREEVAHA